MENVIAIHSRIGGWVELIKRQQQQQQQQQLLFPMNYCFFLSFFSSLLFPVPDDHIFPEPWRPGAGSMNVIIDWCGFYYFVTVVCWSVPKINTTHCVFYKQDWSNLYSLRNTLFDSFRYCLPPACPLPFRATGISRKGPFSHELAPQSIIFQRLLQRPVLWQVILAHVQSVHGKCTNDPCWL